MGLPAFLTIYILLLRVKLGIGNGVFSPCWDSLQLAQPKENTLVTYFLLKVTGVHIWVLPYINYTSITWLKKNVIGKSYRPRKNSDTLKKPMDKKSSNLFCIWRALFSKIVQSLICQIIMKYFLWLQSILSLFQLIKWLIFSISC